MSQNNYAIQNSKCIYCFGPFGCNPQAPFHRTKKCRNPNNMLSLVANTPSVNSQAVVLMGAKSSPIISGPGMGVMGGPGMGVMGGPGMGVMGGPGMGVMGGPGMGVMGGPGMGVMGGNTSGYKKKYGSNMQVHVHHHHHHYNSTGSNQANSSGTRIVNVGQGHISRTKSNPKIIFLGPFP
jgi:hypothetical protein